MKTDGNDSIFRQVELDGYIREIGLNKRELFTAMAMLGEVARARNEPSDTASRAVEIADALIDQLNQKESK